MRVGELCALLSAYPDNTPIVVKVPIPIPDGVLFEELLLDSYSVEVRDGDIALVFERVERKKRDEYEWDDKGDALRQVTEGSSSEDDD